MGSSPTGAIFDRSAVAQWQSTVKTLIQQPRRSHFLREDFVACINFAPSVWLASSAKMSASASCERRGRTSALPYHPKTPAI